MIQVSPVHSGLCESPQTAIEKLVRQLVHLNHETEPQA
jgi:hypothetical protein